MIVGCVLCNVIRFLGVFGLGWMGSMCYIFFVGYYFVGFFFLVFDLVLN